MTPKIADFGIARMVTSQTMVYTSSVIGSVHYLSPEQAGGCPVTAQSDIYSLGIVLYEMLTGHVPFDGKTAVAVAMMHLEKTPPPLKSYDPDLPDSLQEVIHLPENGRTFHNNPASDLPYLHDRRRNVARPL